MAALPPRGLKPNLFALDGTTEVMPDTTKNAIAQEFGPEFFADVWTLRKFLQLFSVAVVFR
jgi:hypothetical protein